MTDPVLQLSPSSLTIAPGAQARATLVVENIGNRVEGFRLELLGAAAAWASAEPETVEVYPGASQQAVIAFAVPPVGAVPSGSFPFGVRAVSLVDHYSADVAEGSVEIGPVTGLAPSLTPVTSSGRWKGRHTLTISNWGNTPASVRLTASDPDERLGFLVRPTQLDLPLGATRVARLTVRTRRPSLRAAQQRLPFTVVGEPLDAGGTAAPSRPSDTERPIVDGAFLQRPILGRGVVAAALLLVLGVVAAAALLLRGGGSTPAELRTGFPLPPPADLTATARSSSLISLAWQPVPSAVSYRVVEVDAADRTRPVRILEPVEGELSAVDVPELAPLTEHCFTVAAVSAAESRGRPTEPACATTPIPTGNGDLPGPAQFIAVRAAYITLGNASAAEASARAERARLAAAEAVQPGLLDSGLYPQLQQVTNGRAWVVYEGPFDSQADAEVVCAQKPRCRAVAAGARQDAAAPPAAPVPPVPPSPVPPATPPPASGGPTTAPPAVPAPTSGATSAPTPPEPSPTA